MNHDLVDTYLDLISELNVSSDPDITAIRRLLAEVEGDANLNRVEQALLRGYMGYHFQEVLTQVDCEAEFRQVLVHDSENHLANLHLGYQTFDTENYATALKQFQKIDLNKHFLWSQIKIRELIVCCHLHLKQFSEAEELMFPVLQKANEIERVDYALPTELLRALVENAKEFQYAVGRRTYGSCLKLLNQVIQHHDLEDLFQKELRQLQLISESEIRADSESN